MTPRSICAECQSTQLTSAKGVAKLFSGSEHSFHLDQGYNPRAVAFSRPGHRNAAERACSDPMRLTSLAGEKLSHVLCIIPSADADARASTASLAITRGTTRHTREASTKRHSDVCNVGSPEDTDSMDVDTHTSIMSANLGRRFSRSSIAEPCCLVPLGTNSSPGTCHLTQMSLRFAVVGRGNALCPQENFLVSLGPPLQRCGSYTRTPENNASRAPRLERSLRS